MTNNISTILAGIGAVGCAATAYFGTPEMGEYLVDAMNITQKANDNPIKTTAVNMIKYLPTAFFTVGTVVLADAAFNKNNYRR